MLPRLQLDRTESTLFHSNTEKKIWPNKQLLEIVSVCETSVTQFLTNKALLRWEFFFWIKYKGCQTSNQTRKYFFTSQVESLWIFVCIGSSLKHVSSWQDLLGIHCSFYSETTLLGNPKGYLVKQVLPLQLSVLHSSGCKYQDPMVGASPSFQGRITEMAQLEVETIRFEKTKKSKKKASSS